jgi:transcriptional regulator with XRE-family HTH domain
VAIPIGDNLQRLRRAAQLTQQDLAVKAGLAVSVVSQIEQGRNRNPSIATALALAKVLGVSLDVLASEKGVAEVKSGRAARGRPRTAKGKARRREKGLRGDGEG